MSLLKLADGRVIEVNEEDFTVLDETRLIRLREEAKRRLDELDALTDDNEPTDVTTPNQPETPLNPPIDNPPAQPEQPVQQTPTPQVIESNQLPQDILHIQ